MLTFTLRIITHIILLSSVVSLPAALALTTIQESLEDSIRRSTLIVHGTVMKVDTLSDDHRTHTIATFRIHQALKGTAPHTVSIQQVGGTYKGLSQFVVGIPLLKTGEEWILFLEPISDQSKGLHYRLLAGPHGAQKIIKNERGEKVIKSRHFHTKKTMTPKTVKLVKVNLQPKLRLKGPIFKKAEPSIPSPPHSTIKLDKKVKRLIPKTPTTLNGYINELKISVDRSLAPKQPSH